MYSVVCELALCTYIVLRLVFFSFDFVTPDTRIRDTTRRVDREKNFKCVCFRYRSNAVSKVSLDIIILGHGAHHPFPNRHDFEVRKEKKRYNLLCLIFAVNAEDTFTAAFDRSRSRDGPWKFIV